MSRTYRRKHCGSNNPHHEKDNAKLHSDAGWNVNGFGVPKLLRRIFWNKRKRSKERNELHKIKQDQNYEGKEDFGFSKKDNWWYW